jgi:para-nitrobenzyl esterase
MPQTRRRWTTPLIRAITLMAAAGLVVIAAASPAGASDLSVVRTANGLVRGTVGSGIRTFLGVPFAAPPIGALRFRSPQPAASWQGVRNATHFGSPCPQVAGIFAPNGQGSTNEDCLFLNVYTPTPARSPRPVMVWIHGGGFTAGSASQYDASVLSARGQAVVVTINYRLGPIGFLALPGLSAESRDGSSGNYGIEDQQAALRWVRRNIAAFGGNPSDVTIFGESAGGLSVCDQLVSPRVANLFQRAITESGPCAARQATLAAAEAQSGTAAARVGCADPATQVACLRALPVATLLTSGGFSGPNVDGAVLPKQIPDAIAAGRFNRVPVMEGTNHDEDRLFVALQFDLAGHPVTAQQYPALVQALAGAHAAQVLARYPLSSFASPSLAWATVVTDARFSCGALLADGLLAAHVPTFAYEFNDRSAPEFIVTDPVMPLGAFHASEIPFVFQPAVAAAATFFTPAQLALSDQMIRYWISFARSGSPNAEDAPHWSRFSTRTARFQSLTPGDTDTIQTFADDHNCAFWASVSG